MVDVVFSYSGRNISIQCSEQDSIRNICNKFIRKIDNNIDNLIFLYGGKQLNLDLTFNEQSNYLDKMNKRMSIVVFEAMKSTIIEEELINSKEIICPICKENCRIKFENYKIKLYECKNNHETSNITLENYFKTQKINETNIICNNCKQINKNKAYKKKFFICLSCKQNLCPLCKSVHNKKDEFPYFSN